MKLRENLGWLLFIGLICSGLLNNAAQADEPVSIESLLREMVDQDAVTEDAEALEANEEKTEEQLKLEARIAKREELKTRIKAQQESRAKE